MSHANVKNNVSFFILVILKVLQLQCTLSFLCLSLQYKPFVISMLIMWINGKKASSLPTPPEVLRTFWSYHHRRQWAGRALLVSAPAMPGAKRWLRDAPSHWPWSCHALRLWSGPSNQAKCLTLVYLSINFYCHSGHLLCPRSPLFVK